MMKATKLKTRAGVIDLAPVSAGAATAIAPVPNPAGPTDAELTEYITGVLAGVNLSTHTVRAYTRALTGFAAWWRDTGRAASATGALGATAVQEWVRSLYREKAPAPATVNQYLAAVRALFTELARRGVITWAEAYGVTTVKGPKVQGVRRGRWLTPEETARLLAAPGMTTPQGVRDTALMALMVSSGLRRGDIGALTVGHFQQLGGRWAVVNLRGKGGRVGTIPVANWAYDLCREWWRVRADIRSNARAAYVHGDDAGQVKDNPHARAFTRTPNGRFALWRLGHFTHGLQGQAVANLVRKYGVKAGLGAVDAHDLRRTSAELAKAGGADLKQIQHSLRHSSVATTERYLGGGQDMVKAPCDYIEVAVPVVPVGGVGEWNGYGFTAVGPGPGPGPQGPGPGDGDGDGAAVTGGDNAAS